MKNKESLFDTATPSKLRRWALLALVGALAATATVLFSAWPVMAQDPPARPTGLTGTVAHNQVALSWDNPRDDAITGYQVLRRDKSINGLGDFPVLVDDTGKRRAFVHRYHRNRRRTLHLPGQGPQRRRAQFPERLLRRPGAPTACRDGVFRGGNPHG